MKLFVLLILSLAALSMAQVDYQRCDDPNEFWTECGTGCPETCVTLHWKKPPHCSGICRAGCFCRPGLVRLGHAKHGSGLGPCVPTTQCPGRK